MGGIRIGAVGLSVAVLSVSVIAVPEAQTIFSSFEGITTTPGAPFDLGFTPTRATFSGNAFSATLLDPRSYHTGLFAWMVQSNSVGHINFETNAAIVQFWARTNPSGGSPTIIEAFDAGNNSLGQTSVTQLDGWKFFNFAGDISRIEVTNTDALLHNSIDDFGYTPVPAPGAAVLLSIGACVTGRRRRRYGVAA